MNHLSPLILSLLLVYACTQKPSVNTLRGEMQQVILEMDEKVNPELLMPRIDSIPVSYLLGQFNPADEKDFIRIRDVHSAGNARGAYLHKEAYLAFVRMHEAAKKAGIQLIIKSATRNFYRQKQIWEGKWTGARLQNGENLVQTTPDPVERARKILHTSSMPGTSRHHWGTDMDLNAFSNSYFSAGKGKAEYEWLLDNALDYGFGQPYTEQGEDRPFGYEEERWHWSYLPLSRKYLVAYQEYVKIDMIKGFKGAEAAAPLKVIQHYVSGINPACK